MKLNKVIYELYDSEYEYAMGLSDSEKHELDREVRLEFDDDTVTYVYWSDEPIQFCVGYKSTRAYSTEPEKIINVSNWPMWQPFINNEINIAYIEDNNEMIEISTKNNSLFFWAGGNHGSDTLCVSTQKPKVKMKLF